MIKWIGVSDQVSSNYKKPSLMKSETEFKTSGNRLINTKLKQPSQKLQRRVTHSKTSSTSTSPSRKLSTTERAKLKARSLMKVKAIIPSTA